ncbi:hypothetical protein M9H77_19485 [Catharanthus roseus]|uniref:Uncharacterized protein n=1 Tax=Catharanthus roseus TaxID=4058 RepID=A0ACC0BAF6_CATRO|nr:hypothetical protein M9H77_19485 [Catharanthus roseus]
MMYSSRGEKHLTLREEKSRKNPKNPSFSSTLLDEIFRSIDGNDDKTSEELKIYREITSVKKYNCTNNVGFGVGARAAKVEDEEIASLKRACMIEKWMEKKVNDKMSSRRRPSSSFQDNDPLFFSSTSTSSDSNSSSSCGFSSSDTEFFSSSSASTSARSRKSCFVSPWPKPVRTSVSQISSSHELEENMMKSKSRALKIYENLKKVKQQPISPGGRLTNFINSLFTNGNSKKTHKSQTSTNNNNQESSTCSSASSFSRSCLSKKTPPNSRGGEMRNDDGSSTKRTVRFYPVSVIVDEDCRPCGHKSIYEHDDDSDSIKYGGRPPLPQKLHKKIELERENLKTFQNQKKNNFVIEDEDDDFDDGASDSSSDLFEIDHLSLFGGNNNRFREELPVYETTHLHTNLAIASGLIR